MDVTWKGIAVPALQIATFLGFNKDNLLDYYSLFSLYALIGKFHLLFVITFV